MPRTIDDMMQEEQKKFRTWVRGVDHPAGGLDDHSTHDRALDKMVSPYRPPPIVIERQHSPVHILLMQFGPVALFSLIVGFALGRSPIVVQAPAPAPEMAREGWNVFIEGEDWVLRGPHGKEVIRAHEAPTPKGALYINPQ